MSKNNSANFIDEHHRVKHVSVNYGGFGWATLGTKWFTDDILNEVELADCLISHGIAHEDDYTAYGITWKTFRRSRKRREQRTRPYLHIQILGRLVTERGGVYMYPAISYDYCGSQSYKKRAKRILARQFRRQSKMMMSRENFDLLPLKGSTFKGWWGF